MDLKTLTFGAALTALAACGSSNSYTTTPTNARTTDPILKSIITSFKEGCIDNAPDFNSAKVKADFAANEPTLAPSMFLVASGQPGKSCSVGVRGYGTSRPAPTYGDLNALVRVLHTKTGGTITLKTSETSAQVKYNNAKRLFVDTLLVTGSVDSSGTLRLSVF